VTEYGERRGKIPGIVGLSHMMRCGQFHAFSPPPPISSLLLPSDIHCVIAWVGPATILDVAMKIAIFNVFSRIEPWLTYTSVIPPLLTWLQRLLTFQVPNLMSFFQCSGHTKESVQIRGALKHFVNNKKCLRLGVVGPTPKPQAGGQPLVGCPRLLIQYIRSSLRTRRTWGT
jgi:hypothetical protein